MVTKLAYDYDRQGDSLFIYSVEEYEYEGGAIKIVSVLTNILRTDSKRVEHNLTDRVCEFDDKISREKYIEWSFSMYEKNNQILMSFLNWLASN